ncbi:MAG: TlpA family protein disulfide reductase [Asticcacaulis sp.]|nr:TlpA family protein disulfide reductase [Asticcacaulis sp.]
MHHPDRRAVLASGLAAAAALPFASPALAGATIGKLAPKFTLTTFDHRKVKSSDLAGEVVVLNYWAVWCGPCKHELPELDAYVRKRGTDAPRIFAVTVDNAVSDSQLKPLAKILSFPLVTRIDSMSYGPIDGAVPSTYVIDRAGVLRYGQAAAFTYASFDRLITPLLNEPRPKTVSTAST